ncbi:MAG: N(4)-(beta-N-acetylglucosaminyl)-L-asparaginase [Phycisphaeraceae bacterium]|nr:MAG: N(4)-(beta-N-acetylglucosaminyl)-L-asparaginase [Phycisphaeraceae bacterium]
MCVVASVNGLPAVRRARELMATGTDPLDAIVDGVAIIEDDPEDTSVGLGGLPNQDGIVELDASVMYGPTHKSGAVASLRSIKNPARVALLVCRRTDHCLLVGEGALRFARQMGFKEQDLLTEASRRAWQQWRENMSKEDDWLNDDERDEPVGKVLEQPGQPATPGQRARHHDDPGFTTGTVHVSGVTAAGDVASCTSTSGLSWKIPGRVGDSPIIGAGNYCDNAVGAAGCTGRGEAAIVNLSAHTIVSFMEHGMSPSAACLEAMKRVADRTKEKRLRDGKGRPNFDLKMYAVRKDGAWGGASMYAGASMAVADGAGARAVKIPSLFDHPLG